MMNRLIWLLFIIILHAEEIEKEIFLEKGLSKNIELPLQLSSIQNSDPSVIQAQITSDFSLFIQAANEGESMITGVNSESRPAFRYRIIVQPNINQLRKYVNKINAQIKLNPINNSIIVSGTADSPEQAKQIIDIIHKLSKVSIVNNMTIAGSNTVTLMVKVVEVSRHVDKKFGINLETILKNIGNVTYGFASGRDFGITDDSNGISNIQANGANSTSPTTTSSNGSTTDNKGIITSAESNRGTLFLGSKWVNKSFDSVLDVMASEGIATINAQPNLTTSSGYPVEFTSGGEFQVLTQSQVSGGAPTTTFKEYGIKVTCTPIILRENLIQVDVNIEVSSLDKSMAAVGLKKRTIKTTVNVASGSSFVIAGLTQKNQNALKEGTQGLMNLPILGTLFRKNSFDKDDTELVIIITPIISKPYTGKFTTPDQFFKFAGDFERNFQGKLLQPVFKNPRLGISLF